MLPFEEGKQVLDGLVKQHGQPQTNDRGISARQILQHKDDLSRSLDPGFRRQDNFLQ